MHAIRPIFDFFIASSLKLRRVSPAKGRQTRGW
jgi:hypothetical protein